MEALQWVLDAALAGRQPKSENVAAIISYAHDRISGGDDRVEEITVRHTHVVVACLRSEINDPGSVPPTILLQICGQWS